ncbi:peroxiredoxin [Pararhodobacter sp.]|uniref:peroxiredoxin n=1 Tax=Pararhodobacter sp. TaxID=2127056 RepID=UPI002AFDCF77|nr:peroxiredoxin [Pararhodobacter sp.]
MPISVGDKLPEATFTRMGPKGPEQVTLSSLTAGRKVVIFAVPGAFTPTCHSAHVPGFIANKDALLAKGVDEIICVSVNDAFVMNMWGDATGATKAGITMLSDGAGEFAKAIDMVFDAPPVGLYGRSKRYALAAEDGVVTVWHPETTSGCEVSGGGAMLAAL